MKRTVLFAALALLTGEARADLFTTQQSFLQALGANYTMESFEHGRPTAFTAQQQSPYVLNGQQVTGIWDSSIFAGAVGGKYPLDGTHYLDQGSVTTTDESGSVILTFHTPITAIGFGITDFGDTRQPSGHIGVLSVSTDLGQSWVLAQTPQVNANLIFFGLIGDTPFSRCVISNTSVNDGTGIDPVYFRTAPQAPAVPEPSSLAVGGVAITLLLLIKRLFA